MCAYSLQIEEQKKKADSRAQPTWDGRYATIARVRDQASHIAMMPETQAEWLRQQAELAAKQVGPRVPATGAPGRTVASIPVTEHAAASMPVSTPQQQHAGSSAQSGAAPPATSAQAAAQYAEMYARMQQQQQARVRQLEGSSDASVLTAAVTARPPPSSTRDEGA